ncbi:angiopoietin-related protein 7-like isoform X2 [Mytilus trossulus]|uniref:angiopoietin-related protein 7-like isoform X2 n=1 Tax=Mytilus trossulus TaxID=6551 RepID=UPI003005BBE7
MKIMKKTISFIVQMVILSIVHVNSKPCSKSNSECKPVRMPLISNDLKAPLVAELDITSVNKQLESYINDDIKSTFSDEIQDMVKIEQDQTKTSMFEDYSLKLNTTKKEYDKRFSNIVQNLEGKQKAITREISEVYKNLSESESAFNTEITDSLSGFEHRQESLKLAMMSEYLSKLQQSQDANDHKFNDLACDLKSHFANLSQELREEFKKSTTNLQIKSQALEEWKTNLMETLNKTVSPLNKTKDCSYLNTTLSGVYTIFPDEFNRIQAYCDMSTDGGGWTVLQRRIDRTTSFDRNWIDYKEGFGDPQTEYWLGNKYLNILTSKDKYELRVDLTDTNNKQTYAVYKRFSVGDENSKYKLSIGDYSGTAGNYMVYNNGIAFTNDKDNDDYGRGNCAAFYGPWWHIACSNSYLNDKEHKLYYWGGYKYNKTQMMIRKIL